MKSLVKKFLKDTNGATAIEYALIAGLISIAIVGGATAIGSSSTVTMSGIRGAF